MSTLDSPKRLFNAFRRKPPLGTLEGFRFTLPKLGKNPSLKTLFVSRLPLNNMLKAPQETKVFKTEVVMQ